MLVLVTVATLAVGSCGNPNPTESQTGPRTLSDIDATGTTDVTKQLNAYVASVPDGSVIELPAGACYKVEGTLRLIDRHRITIDGNGATIFAETDGSGFAPQEGPTREWPRGRRHIEIIGGSEIAVRNLTIRGPHANPGPDSYVTELEGQHGIRVVGTQGITIEGVTIRNVHGDFVYLGMDVPGPRTTNAVVRDNHFSGSGRQGIALTGVEHVVIEDNSIDLVARTVFDIEPNSNHGGALDVLIRRNRIGVKGNNFLSAGGGGIHVDGIVVEDNTLVGTNMNVTVKGGIVDVHKDPETGEWTRVRERRGSFVFLRNRSDYPNAPAKRGLMLFTLATNVTVRDNIQPLPQEKSAVLVQVRDVLSHDVGGNQVAGGTELKVD